MMIGKIDERKIKKIISKNCCITCGKAVELATREMMNYLLPKVVMSKKSQLSKERDLKIYEMRRDGVSYRNIADRFGISIPRVRQIEHLILRKIKFALLR